ncbi:hypothetical protein HYALB_00012269 [Hymenoscyphus albidus]|uniref:Protein kinase domain-containing protein n=1 Tax=Hymenoscyphus albidus TaxID=595503 RepID=A0A9N9PXI8_9HELO|nr:hypothetical protein HYALB_00012269 [Hymenoscyphus albidus]
MSQDHLSDRASSFNHMGLPDNQQDFQNYLTQLEVLPSQIQQAIARRKGIAAPSKRSKNDSTSHHNLGTSIRAALEKSQAGKENEFLPNDKLNEIVARDCVHYQLSHHNLELNSKETTRKKIFAILGLMDKFEAILDFINEELFDTDLPFTLTVGALPGTRRLTRKQHNQKQSSGEVKLIPIPFFENWKTHELESFDRYQWCLTAPYFHTAQNPTKIHCITVWNMDEEVSGRPERNQGGFSDVWRVKIHPAHHNLCHDAVGHYLLFMFSSNDQSSNLSPNYQNPSYALERLRSNIREPFDLEVDNLKRFSSKDNVHLTKLLVTFSWRDQYYLVFPWADSNLLNYWKQNPVPSIPIQDKDLAVWLSEQCLGVAKGLKMIHNLNVLNGSAREVGYQKYGRHGDLKPENILWFKDYQQPGGLGTLKISDFGLTRFHGEGSKSHAENVSLTGTYRPPEYEIAQLVSQSYDIWSFGCLLLEFVTWYLLGWEGFDDFSKARMNEDTESIVPEDVFFCFVRMGGENGEQLARAKPSVANQINQLYRQSHGSDYILEFLKFIEERLIRIDPTKRATCWDIVNKLSELHDKCRGDANYCTRRSDTSLSELSASAFKLSREKRDRNHKSFAHEQGQKSPLPSPTEAPASPGYPFLSDSRGRTRDRKDHVCRAASPSPNPSLYRTSTVKSGSSSIGTQCSGPPPPSKKVVHFENSRPHSRDCRRLTHESGRAVNKRKTTIHHEGEERRDANTDDNSTLSSPLEITDSPICTLPPTALRPSI